MSSPGAVIANPGMPVAMPVAIPVSTSNSPKHSGSSSDGECVCAADVLEVHVNQYSLNSEYPMERGKGLLTLTCYTTGDSALSSLPPVGSLSPSSATESPNMAKVMMGMPFTVGMPMAPPKLPPRLQTIRSSQLKLHLPGGGTVKLPSADASK